MKLTTKLLLGATVIAGLSISAFAACANHVDMGTKNLTNVAEPTESHHAATKGYIDTRVTGLPVGQLICDDTVHSLGDIGGVSYNENILVISQSHARTATLLNTHFITQVTLDLSYSSTYSVQTAPNDTNLSSVTLTNNQPLAVTINSTSDSGYKCLSGQSFSVHALGR